MTSQKYSLTKRWHLLAQLANLVLSLAQLSPSLFLFTHNFAHIIVDPKSFFCFKDNIKYLLHSLSFLFEIDKEFPWKITRLGCRKCRFCAGAGFVFDITWCIADSGLYNEHIQRKLTSYLGYESFCIHVKSTYQIVLDQPCNMTNSKLLLINDLVIQFCDIR